MDSETRPGRGGRDRSGEKIECFYGAETIGCTSGSGKWSNERQCWVKRADEQPPRSDPIWDNHDGGEIYWCLPPYVPVPVGRPYQFWAPSAPPLVDPVVLAEEAIERMRLVNPTIATTPLNPDAPMVVGVPTWLWLADDGEHAFGPLTRSATAGSTTVTATARVTSVSWDMGDGTTVRCMSPGTPWTPTRGTGPSPTCGHTYQRASVDEPDHTYDVTATVHWRVDWTGAGQTGQITFTLTDTRELEVTEIQVLQTR